jgi:hypothetical protein
MLSMIPGEGFVNGSPRHEEPSEMPKRKPQEQHV